MRWSFAAFAAHQRCGAPGIRAAQRSLTLTLSRQRARELEGGGVDWRETRCNLTPNPFPCGKGNNRAFSASELASYLCWKCLDVAFLALPTALMPGAQLQAGRLALLESIVTAPLGATPPASDRPFTVAPVFKVIEVLASMFPSRMQPAPIVAELPTCQ